MQPDSEIGDRLRALRLQRGWSIRHAASRAGISHVQWSYLERGVRRAKSLNMLNDIAGALNIPLSDLTGGAETPQKLDSSAAVRRVMQAVVATDLDDRTTRAILPVGPLLARLDTVMHRRLTCDYTGAARLLPDLLYDLHAAAHGPERDTALRALVIANDTASFVVRYLGDATAAVLVADRAAQAARHLDDPVMTAMSAWTQTHAATGCGLPARALRIASRAVSDLEPHIGLPEAKEMLGQLYVLNGFALYAQGDQAGADAAVRAAADLAGHTGQTDALGLYFGPTNVTFWQVGMQVENGDPQDAVHTARAIDPSAMASIGRSRRIAYYIDTSRALVAIKRDEPALRMLLAAEREAPQRVRLSPVVTETVRALLERSKRGAGWTELRALSERVGITP